jgi:hypothetical protein
MKASIKAFIIESLNNGMDNEMLEDALVGMCLVKSYAQAKRAITLATK